MKKAYSKVKAQEESAQSSASLPIHNEATRPSPESAHSSLELHPDRQAMLEGQDSQIQLHEEEFSQRRRTDASTKNLRRKPSGYKKEMEAATQRRIEFEAKRQARGARERDRKAMTKAKRPGKDGKVKLGRQGNVLLSRIQRMTKEGKI